MVNKSSVIILAGGVGSRFGGDEPKQFSFLKNKTILEWTVSKAIELFNDIIVVYNANWEQKTRKLLKNISNLRFIPGGDEYSLSIENALKLVNTEYVYILEAARPNFSSKHMLEMENFSGNVISLKKNNDAIYAFDKNISILDRKKIFCGVTPQRYRTTDIKKIVNISPRIKDSIEGLILLNLPFDKVVVPETNIKVTLKEDLETLEEIF